MHPKDKMNEDLKVAMKSGDNALKDMLRLMLAAVKQSEVDTRTTLSEEQVSSLLQKEAKKRRESIDEAEKAGRGDIADRERAELAIIERYLPQQLTKDEIEAEVRKAIQEAGATSSKDMGNVMKLLTPRVKGKADGKVVNDVVKALLS